MELEFLFSTFYLESGVVLSDQDIVEVVRDRAWLIAYGTWRRLIHRFGSTYKTTKYSQAQRPSLKILEEIEGYLRENPDSEVEELLSRFKNQYAWTVKEADLSDEAYQLIERFRHLEKNLGSSSDNIECQHILIEKRLEYYDPTSVISVPGCGVKVHKFLDPYPNMYLVVHPSQLDPSAFTEQSVEQMRKTLERLNLIAEV
jgi:hypothetical protein